MIRKIREKFENFIDNNLSSDIHEFKPAIVEIQDQPISPAGRFISWIFCLIILIAFVWSYFAKIDIIATSQGKIVPIGSTKIVQSSYDGMIKSINIKEGKFVKKGELILEFDNESYKSENESLEKSLASEKVKYNRAMNLIKYYENKKIIELPIVKEKTISPKMQKMLFEQEYKDFESSVAMLKESLIQKTHELENIKSSMLNYKDTLKINELRAKKYKGLMEQKISSEIEYLNFEERRIREKNEYEALINKQKQVESNILELKEKIQFELIENKKKQLLVAEESFNNMNKLEEDINKNNLMIKYSQIKSPVNGFIQELNVHTIGGVLEKGQEILKIVEENSDIEIETYILSKDIGFIQKGMEVEIKVDSFLFTKYGIVKGIVDNISEDAIQDEKMGLVYKTKIKMLDKEMNIEGKKIKLSYGMSITSEIKTGTRTVLEFFLSPITKALDESVKER